MGAKLRCAGDIIMGATAKELNKKPEVIVFAGPNGSGKSTFLRCLNLMEVPTSGEILFEGKSITSAKPKEVNILRQKM